MAKLLKTITIIKKIYYDPDIPSAFSNLQKLRLATVEHKKKKAAILMRAWLEKQDAYTPKRCRYYVSGVPKPRPAIAVVDRVNRTFRERLYMYFTHKNTYRLSMFCRKFSGPTMTWFTRRLAWRPRESQIQTACHMEENKGGSGARSCSESEVLAGAARTHQQREDAVCRGCRTEF